MPELTCPSLIDCAAFGRLIYLKSKSSSCLKVCAIGYSVNKLIPAYARDIYNSCIDFDFIRYDDTFFTF